MESAGRSSVPAGVSLRSPTRGDPQVRTGTRGFQVDVLGNLFPSSSNETLGLCSIRHQATRLRSSLWLSSARSLDAQSQSGLRSLLRPIPVRREADRMTSSDLRSLLFPTNEDKNQ